MAKKGKAKRTRRSVPRAASGPTKKEVSIERIQNGFEVSVTDQRTWKTKKWYSPTKKEAKEKAADLL